jgi:adenine specific DNA methylase Mod
MNELHYGDNLGVLRNSIKPESVDLIYLDPPFNSSANYNVLFKAPSGEGSQAQIEAFEDTWHWNESAERAFDEVIKGENSEPSVMLRAMRTALGENDMMAYLAMMAVRLVELHKVLKPTGTLYLHCDPTASAYLKIILDSIFGPERYLNEIIWRRTGSHNPRRSYGPVHDVIHAVTKSPAYRFNVVRRPYMKGHVESRYTRHEDGRMRFTSGGNVLTGKGATGGPSGQAWRGFEPSPKNRHWAIPGFYEELMPPEYQEMNTVEKLEALYQAKLIEIKEGNAWPIMVRFLEERDGVPLTDLWTYQPYTDGTVWGEPNKGIDEDVAWLGPTAPERLGYPTQKPTGLLERIILSSSNEGDVVLDPFCGCGTTVHAAEKLKRRWIGIDVTHLAISLIERRLRESFAKVEFEVHGIPKDAAGARDLAERDKYEFQKWITAIVGAQPYKSGKKGMDRGIDGFLHFRDAEKKPQVGIVSVKGGGTKSGDVRDLKGTMEREGAALGLFLTLNEPTKEMVKEAASAGLYETGGMKVPRLQILTAAEVIEGRRPRLPFGHSEGFKKAAVEDKIQEKLL